jgi:hypothetical protein
MTHSQEWQIILWILQYAFLYFAILYSIAFVSKSLEFLARAIKDLDATIPPSRVIRLALLWTIFFALRSFSS